MSRRRRLGRVPIVSVLCGAHSSRTVVAQFQWQTHRDSTAGLVECPRWVLDDTLQLPHSAPVARGGLPRWYGKADPARGYLSQVVTIEGVQYVLLRCPRCEDRALLPAADVQAARDTLTMDGRASVGLTDLAGTVLK